MFENGSGGDLRFGDDADPVAFDPELEPNLDLSSMPSPVFVPEVAWASASRFEAGDPESEVPWIPLPDWCVIDGVPQVQVGAARPKDAWEQAADWTQDRIRDRGMARREVDRDLTLDLLIGFDASMQDLRSRFDLAPGADRQHGAKAFYRQTALDLGMMPWEIKDRVETGQDAQRRLPQTWALYLALKAPWRAVRYAVDECDGLDADKLAAYDTAAARILVDEPLSRVAQKLKRARERLQDDTATARAKTTEQRRSVVFREGRDGGATLRFTGPVAGLRAIDLALTKSAIAARRDDEDRTITQLRYDIGLDLLVEGVKQHADPAWPGWLVPKRKGVDCVVAITIPALAWLGKTTEQATLEGVGPIALDTALRLAAGAPSVLRILTDPITGVRLAMDRTVYAPPPDLRRWILYRDQRCRFPGCNRAAADCDIDHADEWQHFGVTNHDNLVCLCRGDHTAKTLRLFQEELRADGFVEWESPWGRHYLDPPPDPADPAPADLLPPRSRVSVDPDEPDRPTWNRLVRNRPRNTDPDEAPPF